MLRDQSRSKEISPPHDFCSRQIISTYIHVGEKRKSRFATQRKAVDLLLRDQSTIIFNAEKRDRYVRSQEKHNDSCWPKDQPTISAAITTM
jgi:hypothetical protein